MKHVGTKTMILQWVWHALRRTSDPLQIIRTGTNAAAVGDTEGNDCSPGEIVTV